ncbi:MAG: hypothetical protein LBF56_00595 [Holosporales bacterium]|jgi:uncharacterized protein YjbJ (UPF0337 family)|nr:hypothetical protein [Holosporales bacterium]
MSRIILKTSAAVFVFMGLHQAHCFYSPPPVAQTAKSVTTKLANGSSVASNLNAFNSSVNTFAKSGSPGGVTSRVGAIADSVNGQMGDFKSSTVKIREMAGNAQQTVASVKEQVGAIRDNIQQVKVAVGGVKNNAASAQQSISIGSVGDKTEEEVALKNAEVSALTSQKKELTDRLREITISLETKHKELNEAKNRLALMLNAQANLRKKKQEQDREQKVAIARAAAQTAAKKSKAY